MQFQLGNGGVVTREKSLKIFKDNMLTQGTSDKMLINSSLHTIDSKPNLNLTVAINNTPNPFGKKYSAIFQHHEGKNILPYLN